MKRLASSVLLLLSPQAVLANCHWQALGPAELRSELDIMQTSGAAADCNSLGQLYTLCEGLRHAPADQMVFGSDLAPIVQDWMDQQSSYLSEIGLAPNSDPFATRNWAGYADLVKTEGDFQTLFAVPFQAAVSLVESYDGGLADITFAPRFDWQVQLATNDVGGLATRGSILPTPLPISVAGYKLASSPDWMTVQTAIHPDQIATADDHSTRITYAEIQNGDPAQPSIIVWAEPKSMPCPPNGLELYGRGFEPAGTLEMKFAEKGDSFTIGGPLLGDGRTPLAAASGTPEIRCLGDDNRCFPESVVLHRFGAPMCSGTLVGKHWVLSAAHCFCGRQPRQASAGRQTPTIGNPFPNLSTSVRLSGRIEFIDPSFCQNRADWKALAAGSPQRKNSAGFWVNDLALAELKRPLRFTVRNGAQVRHALIEPATLADPAHLERLNRVIQVGYGITEFGSLGEKRFAEFVVSGCQTALDAGATCNDEEEFVLSAELGKDSCHGDSGGGAFAHDGDGKSILIALVSRGIANECGPGGINRILARKPVLAWLRSIVGPDLKVQSQHDFIASEYINTDYFSDK